MPCQRTLRPSGPATPSGPQSPLFASHLFLCERRSSCSSRVVYQRGGGVVRDGVRRERVQTGSGGGRPTGTASSSAALLSPVPAHGGLAVAEGQRVRAQSAQASGQQERQTVHGCSAPPVAIFKLSSMWPPLFNPQREPEGRGARWLWGSAGQVPGACPGRAKTLRHAAGGGRWRLNSRDSTRSTQAEVQIRPLAPLQALCALLLLERSYGERLGRANGASSLPGAHVPPPAGLPCWC